jgi:hypothetical protein
LSSSRRNYIYNGTKAGLHDQRRNNSSDIMERWTPETVPAPTRAYTDNVSNGLALTLSSNVEKATSSACATCRWAATSPQRRWARS